MPLRKGKVYSRFNVGKMMKERKEIRDQAAVSHALCKAAKTELETKQAQLRRMKEKVCQFEN